MLFRVKSTKTGSLTYLFNAKQYSVGRKDCDILITNDQSISRKHAILTVKNDRVTLSDCGSKYNTFVDGTKIEAKVENELKSGCKIQFGQLGSFYVFEELKIVTTTSSLKNEQKAILHNNIGFLNGTLSSNWTSQCTHVTVEEIMLTVKVLCAVVKGVPIVNLQYWNDYASNVKKSLDPPEVSNYVPKCSELMLSQNISLDYNKNRLTLFRNKVFIFPAKSDRVKMEDMIILSGGEAVSWDAGDITINDVKNPQKEYLIIQIGDKTDTLDPTLLDLIKYNSSLGKRTIPLQEVALAIVNCSCEKDCNSSFDRTGIVLAPKSHNGKADGTVLAVETQTQAVAEEQTSKTELVVPQSLETNVLLDSVAVPIIQQDSKNGTEHLSLSMKREGDSIESFHVPKKFKCDSADLSTTKSVRINSNKTDGKALFAFKSNNNQIIVNPSKEIVANPFASTKRKEIENNANENPSKRPALETSTQATSSSRSSADLTNNPFAGILKCKNKASLADTNSRKKIRKETPSFGSTIITNSDSLKFDFSKVTIVDSELKSNFSWISKISANEPSRRNITIDDEEISKYVEAFKNSVVIEKESVAKKSLFQRMPSGTNNTNKDFKKFKKVQPLRLQTTIISEANYRKIICNDKNENLPLIPLDEEESEDEVIETVKKLKQRRKFEF